MNTPDKVIELSSQEAIEEGKTMAIVAYLTLIGLILAFVMNNDKKNSFAKYHIRQSLGVMLTGLAVSFIGWIPFIGWAIWIVAFFFLLFTGLFNELNGKEKSLPVLGNHYAEWFKSI